MKNKSVKILKIVLLILGTATVLAGSMAAVIRYVPGAKEGFKNLFNKKSAEQKIVQNSDHYNNLTEEEKKDFDKKLNEITDSDYYKDLDKKGKEELVKKFIESEETLKEVASDPVDKKPEEIEQKIEELKQSGASDEEIKAAEQEKDYWQAVETVKDSTTSNDVFNFHNPGLTIRKINGMYKYQGRVYFNADFIKEEVIDGKSYYSEVNQFCNLNLGVRGDETLEEVMNIISSAEGINAKKTCVNLNAESHKQFFEEEVIPNCKILKILIERGYSLSITESWEIENDPEHPQYIVEAVNGDKTDLSIIEFDSTEHRYVSIELQKICPEFWAQLEIEQQKTQSQPELSAQKFAQVDSQGNYTSFDWNSFSNTLYLAVTNSKICL